MLYFRNFVCLGNPSGISIAEHTRIRVRLLLGNPSPVGKIA